MQVAQGRARSSTHLGAGRARTLAAMSFAALALLLICSASARALSQRGHIPAGSFGATLAGEGDTAMSDPSAVAVDEASGDTYVLDTGNSRVLRFGPAPERRFLEAWGYGVADGAKQYEQCTSKCGPGIAGVHAGQFNLPVAIAVDNSPGPSHGDVYVAANRTFKEAAVDKFTAEGKPLAPLPEEEELVEGGVVGVAVAPDGSVWVEREDEEAEFLLEHFDGAEDNQLMAMEELELQGVQLTAGETYPSRPGFAVDSRGDAYITYERGGKDAEEHGRNEQCTAHVCTTAKVKVSEESQSLEAEMLSSELDEQGSTRGRGRTHGRSAGRRRRVSRQRLERRRVQRRRGADPALRRGHAAGRRGPGARRGDRRSGGRRRDRCRPRGVRAGAARSPDRRGKQRRRARDARIGRTARDDRPDGAVTHYRFQYGTASCAAVPDPCSEAPAAPGGEIPLLGAGFGDQAVTDTVDGLLPATRYHLRVIADNADGESASGERTFLTAATPRELADGRAWEMVSLADKHGSSVEAIRLAGGLVQSAANGRSVTYVTTGPVYEEEAEVEGNRDSERSQILSARGASRWTSHDITTPNEVALGTEPGLPLEYQFFSPELAEALVEPVSPQPLSAEATEKTGYLRHNATCLAERASCFEPLLTTADDTAGSAFALETSFVGATPDLHHIVLHANVALIAGAPKEALYEWSAGKPAAERLQLVSLLPETGAPAPPGAELGGGAKEMHSTAISTSGARVIWRIGGENVGHLYTRDMESGETLQVDEPEEGVTPQLGSIPDFKTASADGSRVYFTDEQHLTKNASGVEQGNIETAPRNLYVFEASKPKGHRVTDLTPESHELNHGEGAGVLGEASVGEGAGGSFVYFVANGKLTSNAEAGHCHAEAPASASCNLYVVHGVPVLEGGMTHERWGAPELIAQLSSEDSPDWGAPEGTETGEAGAYNLKSMTSRVSPDGEHLAFMSERPLTGYDNTDLNSGAADEEVFLYKYAPEGDGQLLCPSCKADGEPPAGVHDTPEVGEGLGLVVDRPETGRRKPKRASITGSRGASPAGRVSPSRDAYYQSRYLSNEGRLFFNSADALVPARATTARRTSTSTSRTCVGSCEAPGGLRGADLLRRIQSESAFLDASANGNDVFFLTAQPLSSQDKDSNFDIYDAHVCRVSGSEPCLSPAASRRPGHATTKPNAKRPRRRSRGYQAPASATFLGARQQSGSRRRGGSLQTGQEIDAETVDTSPAARGGVEEVPQAQAHEQAPRLRTTGAPQLWHEAAAYEHASARREPAVKTSRRIGN